MIQNSQYVAQDSKLVQGQASFINCNDFIFITFQLPHNTSPLDVSSASSHVTNVDAHAIGFWKAVLIPVSPKMCFWCRQLLGDEERNL